MAKQKSAKDAESLQDILGQINNRFGDGTAIEMGSAPIKHVQATSTGALTLDVALGVGGWPDGRIIELFGVESAGKTTVALHAAAEAQKAGGKVAFIDAEHSLDPAWARKLGVDVDALVLSQPEEMEQILEIVDMMCLSGQFDLIIVDSVAAMTPRAELDGNMDDQHVGLQARIMSQALRKLKKSAYDTDTTLMFLNQVRENINTSGFGAKYTTPGGRALKFYCSVRVQVIRIGSIKDGKDGPIIGSKTMARVRKNKVAPPFTEAEFGIYYDVSKGLRNEDGSRVELDEDDLAVYTAGISAQANAFELGLDEGFIKQSGAWYSYGDHKEQGKQNFRVFLEENPDVFAELELKLRDRFGLLGEHGDVEDVYADSDENIVEQEDGSLVNKSTGEVIEPATADA